MIQARIDLLHRRFHRCQLDIDQALRLASHDPDLTQSCEITGALMALAAGKRRSPHDDLPLIVPQSYLASSASAARHLIAAIWSDEPIKIVHEAEVPVGTSDHTTIQHVTDLARAIAWHRATDGSSAPQRDGVSLDTAVEMCVAHGDIFAFVVAYRGFPNLIDVALANPRIADRATAAVASLDRDLAFRHGIAPSPPEPFAGGDLSPRERDVLKLLTEGLTNREIGRRLFISESTAKLHVRRICLKLGVRTRTEAALLAVS
jgi:DNA-binding CsgD family transcriptional regulator